MAGWGLAGGGVGQTRFHTPALGSNWYRSTSVSVWRMLNWTAGGSGLMFDMSSLPT
jgi:hypothetical protein